MRGIALGRAAVLVVAGVLSGCAVMRWARFPDSPWAWTESRSDYLRRSRVWLGKDVDSWVHHMRGLDLATGPPGGDAFAPEQLIRCRYVQPRGGEQLGRTPKFLCRERGADGEPVKVKWGADNGEVFAEVVATRLLWALGFPADRMYPVRVECHGCPEDPWQGGEFESQSTRVFEPAVVERPLSGRTIEEWNHQGWTWAELEGIDAAAGGASRAQIDALRLLGAFLQHRDSKPSNQRLICPPDAVMKERDSARGSCREPIAMVDDLGSTFGGPALLTTHKLDIDVWEDTAVWADPRRCVANLTAEVAATGGLENPQISEEGRRFLSTLLDALDDRQLRALFGVARADRRGGVRRWVAAFKKRRDAVRRPLPSAEFRCPG